MNIRVICILIVTFINLGLYAQDWAGIPVPANPGEGQSWELQAQSDDFNYTHPVAGGGSRFFDKWTDFYHNAWTGPGLTVWDRDHVIVADGLLQIPATRLVQGSVDKISTGCITSTTRVQYPVYIEARAKISNSTLASDVWLLSPDDTQEIDILEAYGTSYSEGAQTSQDWFARRLHLSHHVFVRNPFQDYQPTDSGSWYYNGTLWRLDYHRIGVHWKDPWNLDYYVDGNLVRSVSGESIIDPLGYTGGTGLNKAMDIIINVEDQNWRSDQGITPTDSELANTENHTFKVDWIRVYKPVAVALPAPVITTLQIDQDTLTMGVSNGMSEGTFDLLSSTNLMTDWITNQTALHFDTEGAAVVTNSVDMDQEYYRVQMPGTVPPSSHSPEFFSFDRSTSDWSSKVDAPSVSGNYRLNNQNADSVNAHIMQVDTRDNLQMFHSAGDSPHIIKCVLTVQDASDINQSFRVVSFNWQNTAGTNGDATLTGYSGGISGTVEWTVTGNASIGDLVTTATTGTLTNTIDTIVWETPDYIDEVWGSALDNLSIMVVL